MISFKDWLRRKPLCTHSQGTPARARDARASHSDSNRHAARQHHPQGYAGSGLDTKPFRVFTARTAWRVRRVGVVLLIGTHTVGACLPNVVVDNWDIWFRTAR